MRRSAALALAVATAVGVVLGMPAFSSASYVASSTNTATVSSAADWTPPTVALADPGTPVKGTVTLTATASDAETGIASVTIEYLSASGTWVDVCTRTATPYTCSWITNSLADGSYSLRARATDNAGYSATSATVSTTVANNLLVVMADPGDVVRGTLPVSATIFNPGTTAWSVRFEYTPAGTTAWKTLCTATTSPYSCSWVTTGYTNQDYDLRAVAVSGGTTYTSAVVLDVLVDNLAPTVTMSDPGSPLRGTVALGATASDAHSGVARVVIQYALNGTSTWRDACTVDMAPYTCSYNTTQLADGVYSFRAVATDVAGNTMTSTPVSNRTVDNTVSSVSVNDPGAFLSGIVAVTASANSSAGVTSVRIQRAPAGTTGWVDLCTDTTAPYSCDWDTRTVADGLYDFRAILVDGSGRTTTSTTVVNRRVDNTPFRGVDVQTSNGGATPGKLEVGDAIHFTYSEQLTPSSVTTGWDGTPLAVTLRVRDGNLFGLGNKGDTLDILRNGNLVNLGSVNLKEDYIKSGKTATFNATMSLATTTVNGVTAHRVSVTATSVVLGGGLRTVSALTAMIWTPAAAVLDLSGNPVSTAPVTEVGALDREF